MKPPLLSLALAFTIASLSAQEIIPADQLDKVVPRLIERASDQENLPLKVDGDAANAFGMSANHYGALLIPNKGLSGHP